MSPYGGFCTLGVFIGACVMGNRPRDSVLTGGTPADGRPLLTMAPDKCDQLGGFQIVGAANDCVTIWCLCVSGFI